MNQEWPLNLGCTFLGDDHCEFLVWAPRARTVEVCIVSPDQRVVKMHPGDRGYHHVVVEDLVAGSRYFYRLEGLAERPDPASRFQPEGVHGPSQVVDQSFDWEVGSWPGLPLKDYVLYELHVGTFTPQGVR